MRLAFWRKGEPQWRDGNVPFWGSPEGREQESTCRELSVRMGRERLWVRLIVGVADVTVGLRVVPGLWDMYEVEAEQRHRGSQSPVWELADVPTDPSSLRVKIETLVQQCGCDDALTQRVSPVIVEEMIYQVTKARAQRDRRLSALPGAAPLEWDKSSPPFRHRRGIYTTDAGVIEVEITYEVERNGGMGPWVLLESTKPERRRKDQFMVSLDGICSEGVVQHLETWGWPTETALSVGRAIAIQARADWLSFYPTWQAQLRVARMRVEQGPPRVGSESPGE